MLVRTNVRSRLGAALQHGARANSECADRQCADQVRADHQLEDRQCADHRGVDDECADGGHTNDGGPTVFVCGAPARNFFCTTLRGCSAP